MIDTILKFFAEYLKNKPFTDVLLIVGIGVFLWIDATHREAAKDAHSMVRTVLKERDEAEEKRAEREDERTDRVISALTGVKNEVKKLPEATAAELKMDK